MRASPQGESALLASPPNADRAHVMCGRRRRHDFFPAERMACSDVVNHIHIDFLPKHGIACGQQMR